MNELPTITEDRADRVARAGIFDGDETQIQNSKIEQVMISMLDQRDQLTDQLQKMKHRNADMEDRLRDLEKEKEAYRRQLDLQTQHLPGVNFYRFFLFKKIRSLNFLKI